MLLLILSGAGASLVGYGIWRILFLFLFRQPVTAHLVASMLSEAERLYDYDFRHRGGDLGSGGPFLYQIIRNKVRYHVGGYEYRVDVYQLNTPGQRPAASGTIWCDPKHPEKATGLGIGFAAIFMISGLFLLAVVYYTSQHLDKAEARHPPSSISYTAPASSTAQRSGLL